MFQISAYTISMFDPVETGRTKINYLLTGDSSPFNIWSGTPDSLPYLSAYKVNDENPNYISFSTGAYSADSPFNFIFNGGGNLIDSTASPYSGVAGYNFINGINNLIYNSNQNILIGSGNTVSGTSDGGVNFFHGTSSNLSLSPFVSNVVFGASNEKTTSSYNISSSFLSSRNSKIQGRNSGFFGNSTQFNFLSGENNQINNNIVAPTLFTSNVLQCSFLGNGSGNTIEASASVVANQASAIINGVKNTISVSDASVNDAVIFGSNLTAVSDNYSHFQNLYVDESLMATNINKLTFNSLALESVTLTEDYTFNEFEIDNSVVFGLTIKLPTPSVDLMFLSIVLVSTGVGFIDTNIYFIDNIATKDTVSPLNLSSKPGGNSGAGFNRCIGSLPDGESSAYFFIWTDILNKWVMYSADNSLTATF